MNSFYTILLAIFVTMVSVSESITITSTSRYMGYESGGNIFRVVGTDFPSVPSLILSGPDGPIVFPYLADQSFGNEYRYRVPSAPLDIYSSRKRKHSQGSSYPLSIYFTNSPDPFSTDNFLYITPNIDYFEPTSYYPIANGKEMIINGKYLKINAYDTNPTVTFYRRSDGSYIHLIINRVEQNYIRCQIPDIDPNALKSYSVVLTTYTNLRIGADDVFSYVLPRITSIFPDHGVAGVSQNIEVRGDNFLEADTATATIKFGDLNCNNVEGDLLSHSFFTCDTPIVNIDPGAVSYYPIVPTIDGVEASGNVRFTVYNPIVTSFTPKYGSPNGGTYIVVTGTYLKEVVTAWLGLVECEVLSITVNSNSFTCVTKPYNMGIETQISNRLQVDIGKGVFFSPETEKFTYYTPVVTEIKPSQIAYKGKWMLTITGTGFFEASKVKISDTLFTPSLASNDKTLYIEVDSSTFMVGDQSLLVQSGSDSNAITLKIVKPAIAVVNPIGGYLFSETLITLTVTDFPIGLDAENIRKSVAVTVGAGTCTKLTQVDATTLTCIVPAGVTAKEEDISIFIKKFEYKSTIKFTYFEPTVTSQTQSSTILKGGGNLVIYGTDLSVVDTVMVDTIDITTCTIQPSQITCTIPQHLPGDFDVKLKAKDSKNVYHEYNTGTQISYVGPTLTSVSPKQGSKERTYTLTFIGTGFGTDASLIRVNVDGNNCGSITLVSTTQLTCNIPTLRAGTYNIDIKVKPDSLSDAVESIDTITYRSNALKCLGRPNADNTNDPVDWWFIYKINSPATGGNPYLYIDSTMDRLERRTGLQGSTTTLSPLQATFDQYNNYYYMFFNDQPGSRDVYGARNRNDARKATKGAHGHLKGMVFFDEIDITGNAPGIHIQHTNPVFPSYASTSSNGYSGINQVIKFTGAADFNQHFFCYQYENLDHVMEYILKNDGNLLASMRVFANMELWDQNQQNLFPYLYDYLTPHLDLPERTPNMGSPDATSPKSLIEHCDTVVAAQPNLEDECYWISLQRTIANGLLNAKYFMKIGNHKPVPKYPSIHSTGPNTLSKFVVKKPKSYDGVDIWMVIADHFNKKMFVEFFYAINMKQMVPNEQILNVARLELPTDLAVYTPTLGGGGTYSKNMFSGKSDEHSKIGWPVYPAYGNDKMNANENYFCVGDSNRHNGQGGRGGGSICFQHPTLVYQFNRMVRRYNTITTAGVVTHPSKDNSIELFINIQQPFKLNRPNTWVNDIKVEVKDCINGNHYSKSPSETYTIGSSTIGSATDVTAVFPALRTSRTNVASLDGEGTLVPVPATMTDPDIRDYLANDVMSLHYIAHDPQHASICSYVLSISQCNQINARTTILNKVTGFGYVLPTFPSVYGETYATTKTAYSYDLHANDDFQLMQFTSQFKTKLTGALVTQYQYAIDTGSNILTARFSPPLIYRITNDLCKEEVAYFMTLNYIYNQARSVDSSSIIYKIGSDNPNWANGIILAISKFLYNELTGADANFDACMDNVFSNFGNIETYTDDKSMDNPSTDKIVRRSAAAAWDWMNSRYSDGNGNKIDRVLSLDLVPVTDLIDLMVNVKQSDNVNSMDGLAPFIKPYLKSSTNFETILINNYIIKPPPPLVVKDKDGDSTMIMFKFPSFTLKSSRSLQSISLNENSLIPLVEDEISFDSGVHQLISSSLYTINESLIFSLTPYEEEKLEQAIDKWVVINNQSQAIQVLIKDPTTQYHNQPIKFIEEFNRDQKGNEIDLGYEPAGTTGFEISISTPQSIISITYVLESIIISESNGVKLFGDLEIYYLPKSNNYNGDISSDYNGMIVATLNSQICDIQMISESDYDLNNFDYVCIGSGPIITSVDQLEGSTVGGYQITLNGVRFNTSIIASIGDIQCESTILISSEKLACQVPKGVGTKHQIQLSSDQTLFNLQRTKFLFSYNQPSIDSIEPTIINSYGNDLLTIYGSNFGDDVSKVKVLFNEELECLSIVGISSDHIVCLTPPSVGDHISLVVNVDDQSTKLNLESIQSQDINYSGPTIIGISPDSGDPEDEIVILGEGFNSFNDALTPLVYIGDNLVEIVNFTDQEIRFTLDYETSTNPFILQIGDQQLTTEFSYYPPLVIQFNNTISTTGGLIQILGFGFGLSASEVDFTLSGNTIDCNSFNQFIECYIPPGIGINYILNGSISNQSVDFGITNLVSYDPPIINGFVLRNDLKLDIFGKNFVPSDLGVLFNSSTSYIKLIYSDEIKICTSFVRSNYILCQLETNGLISFQVIVDDQQSNIINI